MVVRNGDKLMPLDRNPLETYLLALCVFSGVLNGIGLIQRGTTLDGTPPPLAAAWYLLLIVGGLGGIIGAYWRDPVTGVLIVRAAMWPTAAGAMMYAFVLPGRAGWVSAILVFVFGLFCAWRAMQITAHVKSLARLRVKTTGAADAGDGEPA